MRDNFIRVTANKHGQVRAYVAQLSARRTTYLSKQTKRFNWRIKLAASLHFARAMNTQSCLFLIQESRPVHNVLEVRPQISVFWDFEHFVLEEEKNTDIQLNQI